MLFIAAPGVINAHPTGEIVLLKTAGLSTLELPEFWNCLEPPGGIIFTHTFSIISNCIRIKYGIINYIIDVDPD